MILAAVSLALLLQGRQIDPYQLARQALDACDSDSTGSPLSTIRAVNAVVSLGPTKSKMLLDDYFGHSTDQHLGLYPFVMCIFDVPRQPGYLQTPKIGHYDPLPPSNLRWAPRFPIKLVGDVPLWIATCSIHGDIVQPAGRHYEYVEQVAGIRRKTLVPIDRPWRVLGPSLIGNYPFSQVRLNQNRMILLLVSTAYRPPSPTDDGSSVLAETPDGWSQIVKQLEAANIRWDTHREMYVRADGSSGSPFVPK